MTTGPTIRSIIAEHVANVYSTVGPQARDDRVDANKLFHAAVDLAALVTDTDEYTHGQFADAVTKLMRAAMMYAPHAAQFSRMMSAD